MLCNGNSLNILRSTIEIGIGVFYHFGIPFRIWELSEFSVICAGTGVVE